MDSHSKPVNAVRFMRQQRERLSQRLAKMTPAEVLEFFSECKKKEGVRPKG
jgi:hypothetical protein